MMMALGSSPQAKLQAAIFGMRSAAMDEPDADKRSQMLADSVVAGAWASSLHQPFAASMIPPPGLQRALAMAGFQSIGHYQQACQAHAKAQQQSLQGALALASQFSWGGS